MWEPTQTHTRAHTHIHTPAPRKRPGSDVAKGQQTKRPCPTLAANEIVPQKTLFQRTPGHPTSKSQATLSHMEQPMKMQAIALFFLNALTHLLNADEKPLCVWPPLCWGLR